jgi:putative hydrolase of the HAD superfamily
MQAVWLLTIVAKINAPMTNQNVKAVLFDFGGVLAEEGFHNGLVAMAREQELDVEAMPAAAMEAVYDSGFVLGRGTAEDFWALLHERAGLTGKPEEMTRRILDGFVVRPGMMALVRELRAQGYVTGILSDQTYWLDELDQKFRFSCDFDHIFNSYYLGKGKQDASLFLDVAAALDLPPASIVFIDDNADNVKRAGAMGMQGIHYVDRQGLLAEMRKLGVQLPTG